MAGVTRIVVTMTDTALMTNCDGFTNLRDGLTFAVGS
jgi:hypothetical protein